MAKTRAQLRTSVMELTKRTDKETLTNDALDFALLELQNEYLYRVVRTEADLSTSQDDVSEALPSGFHRLLEVRLIDSTSSYPIEVRSLKWVLENFPNISADSSSKPDWCYEEGGVLYFSCPLDAAYTIRVTYYALSTFVSDATVNPIPVAESALIFYATSYVYDGLELDKDARKWEKRAQIAALKAKRSDKRRPAEHKTLEEFQGLRGTEDVSTYFIVPDSV